MSFETRIGDARVVQVTELDRWAFPPSDLFPDLAANDRRGALAQLNRDCYDAVADELVLSIHTYVVQLGGRTILVDSGNGNDKQRPNLRPHHMFSTDYLQRLAAAGVTPEQVDLVVSTHLHPDHCGWNTTWTGQEWRPTFPNATYLFAEEELVGIASLAADPPEAGVGADLARTYEDSVRPILDQARWQVVTDGDEIGGAGETRVVVRATPGHTPGHLAVEIDGPGHGAVICGDVIHHPVQLVDLQLSQAGDDDPATARTTRDALLQRCADDGWTLMTAHFPVDEPLAVSVDSKGALSVAGVRVGGGQ